MRSGYEEPGEGNEDGGALVLERPTRPTTTSMPTVYADVPTFLNALEVGLYEDAKELFQDPAKVADPKKKPVERSRGLLDHGQLTVDFLRLALNTIKPKPGGDPQNPTLYYLLQGLIEERTQSKTLDVPTTAPRVTGEGRRYYEPKIITIPRPASPYGDALTQTISGIYSAMAAVADIPPCTNPGAGPVAAKGRPGYRLNDGNLQGLVRTFHARSCR